MATMTKTKPSLVIVSTSNPHKKYLGEPSSPHFIPSSPLIDRQFLTQEEELELKKICTLVLANVQSSDEDVDASFTYLASQIQEEEKSTKHSKKPSELPPVLMTAAGATKPPKFVNDISEDQPTNDAPSTAPTSVLSDHSEPDFSTPLTSAGITPASSAAKRSSGPRIGFLGLGRGSTSSQGSKNTNSAALPPPPTANPESNNSSDRALAWLNSYRIPKPDSQRTTASTGLADPPHIRKSSSRVSATTAARSRSHRRKQDSRSSLGGQIDLNKRLPALPGQPEGAERAKHITRLMKTIRRKPQQVSDSREELLMFREEPSPPELSRSVPSTSHAVNVMQVKAGSEPGTPRRKGAFGGKIIARLEWGLKRQKVPVAPVVLAV